MEVVEVDIKLLLVQEVLEVQEAELRQLVQEDLL